MSGQAREGEVSADRDPADPDRSAGAALAWIASVLEGLRVPFQVVGGLAARAHGATRPLVDIDLYVPAEAIDRVARAVEPHLTRPPARHRDEHWDLVYMKLDYAGRTIEIAAADDARYRDGQADRWRDADIDFDGSERLRVLGVEVPVMRRTRLVEYKRRLGREVDRLDVDLLEPSRPDPLVLENRHTGERLALRRVASGGEIHLEIEGFLPPGEDGPPLHVHRLEDEDGVVRSGTFTARIGDRTVELGPGDTVRLPRGVPHRWWNDGPDPVTFSGRATPVVDLDRYLQAVFEVVNAGPAGRPPLFYMAHVLHRHRATQAVVDVPAPVRRVVLPLVVLLGRLLGRYRGGDWPGCPGRCDGAPLVEKEEV